MIFENFPQILHFRSAAEGDLVGWLGDDDLGTSQQVWSIICYWTGVYGYVWCNEDQCVQSRRTDHPPIWL